MKISTKNLSEFGVQWFSMIQRHFHYTEFLQAKNLSVSLVTCCSAVFYWMHEPKHNVHDVEFLLQCKGQREFINLHKKLVQEEHNVEKKCSSTSKDYETLVVKTLQANTRYACALSPMAGTIKGLPSQQITFTTYPGCKLEILIA